MPTLLRMKSLLRNVFSKQQSDRELDAEVLSYVEILAEEKMRSGMDPEEARRSARIVPPWDRTIQAAMARPRPEPSFPARSSAASPR